MTSCDVTYVVDFSSVDFFLFSPFDFSSDFNFNDFVCTGNYTRQFAPLWPHLHYNIHFILVLKLVVLLCISMLLCQLFVACIYVFEAKLLKIRTFEVGKYTAGEIIC